MQDKITIKKNSLSKILAIALALVLIVGAVVFFSKNDSTELPQTPERIILSIDNDAILGEENATIILIEFSDYQCPFCQIFWAQTLPGIKSEYVETGKLKFIYRDFPITQSHPLAHASAQAAECVREQGGDEAYYSMHDKLFGNQHLISKQNILLWAKELGYDINSCLESNQFSLEVRSDLQDGATAGVTGTPTSFILMSREIADIETLISMQVENQRRPGTYTVRYVETTEGLVGLRIVGAYPFSTFQNAIETGL